MTKKIIVTSGYTTEPIDHVRSLTNRSTGRLGAQIAGDLSEQGAQVYYVYGGHTPPVFNANVKLMPILTIDDLETTLTELLQGEAIHGVVHAMAVSDYRPVAMINDGERVPIPSKISSASEELTLVFAKNKKVISIIKALSPTTTLVGFKLLAGVSQQELIDVARQAMAKHGADIMVANDMDNITANRHHALIIHGEEMTAANTKAGIAKLLREKLLGNGAGDVATGD